MDLGGVTASTSPWPWGGALGLDCVRICPPRLLVRLELGCCLALRGLISTSLLAGCCIFGPDSFNFPPASDTARRSCSQLTRKVSKYQMAIQISNTVRDESIIQKAWSRKRLMIQYSLLAGLQSRNISGDSDTTPRDGSDTVDLVGAPERARYIHGIRIQGSKKAA